MEAQPLHVPGVQNTHYTGGAAVVVLDMVVDLPDENQGAVADAVAAATASTFSWPGMSSLLDIFSTAAPHHHHLHHQTKRKEWKVVGPE